MSVCVVLTAPSWPSRGLLEALAHRILGEVDALIAELATSQSMRRWSKSSPPRWVSPLVLFTSNTPSASSSTLMS
jgi:hypothetical protein